MMIAFYVESTDHVPMLQVSAASAKRVMPEVHIIQIGPHGVPRAAAVDDQREFDLSGNFARRMWRARASVERGDVLFADADTIFYNDVSKVFDQAFDIALPEISDPFLRHTAGIAFSRNPEFWWEYEAMPLCRAQALPPIRTLLEDWNRFVSTWHGAVLKLPADVYEYLPKALHDPCKGAAIAHYRGPRKNWMPGFEGMAAGLSPLS